MGLSYQNRERVERAVVELLDTYGIRHYPIYPRIIAERMGIGVARYQDYPEAAQIKFHDLSHDAFTAFDSNQNQYRIFFYDSGNRDHHRERFSLSHEIGHAWLEHDESSVFTEQEADYFAGYLLMPHPILFALQEQPPEIGRILKTSEAAAHTAFSQAIERQRREGKQIKPHEKWFIKNVAIEMTN